MSKEKENPKNNVKTKVKTENGGSVLFTRWSESVDTGHEQLSKLEDAYIESVKEMANQFEKNQLTYREFLEQVKVEQQGWQSRVAEEYVTATSGLQFIFPFQSLEAVNKSFEQLVGSNESFPEIGLFDQREIGKQSVDWVQKYVSIMRKSREQYLNVLKNTALSIHEQQQNYLNSVEEQVKQLSL